MLSYFQAQSLAAKLGVPEEIIEKDYLIELVLLYLAKSGFLKEKLIFRGGTALKKMYFPEYRFSEDLDFLVGDNENLDEYENKIDKLLTDISADYPFNLNKRLERNKDRIQFFVVYDILTEIKTVKELKVDILRDSLIPAYREKRILFGHSDFKNESLEFKVYVLESVASDKTYRILGPDNEPRDIYDLWYILKQDIDPAKVKDELNKRYGYEVYLPNIFAEINKEVYKRNWHIRLENQIVDLPGYETVIKELTELIKGKLL